MAKAMKKASATTWDNRHDWTAVNGFLKKGQWGVTQIMLRTTVTKPAMKKAAKKPAMKMAAMKKAAKKLTKKK